MTLLLGISLGILIKYSGNPMWFSEIISKSGNLEDLTLIFMNLIKVKLSSELGPLEGLSTYVPSYIKVWLEL